VESNRRSASHKFPNFNGTQRFITVFTRAYQWIVSCARCIQSTPFNIILISSYASITASCNSYLEHRASATHTATELWSLLPPSSRSSLSLQPWFPSELISYRCYLVIPVILNLASYECLRLKSDLPFGFANLKLYCRQFHLLTVLYIELIWNKFPRRTMTISNPFITLRWRVQICICINFMKFMQWMHTKKTEYTLFPNIHCS
jgi:hypothetical protein